jgi:hypothetical protein
MKIRSKKFLFVHTPLQVGIEHLVSEDGEQVGLGGERAQFFNAKIGSVHEPFDSIDEVIPGESQVHGFRQGAEGILIVFKAYDLAEVVTNINGAFTICQGKPFCVWEDEPTLALLKNFNFRPDLAGSWMSCQPIVVTHPSCPNVPKS